jgi:hypothetical protein
MANNSKSVKMSFTLENFSFNFEGDIQIAERMQNQITGALHSIASTGNRLMGPGQPEPTPAPPPVVVVEQPSRGRRGGKRKSPRTSPGIDATILDGEVVANDETTVTPRSSTATGDGPETWNGWVLLRAAHHR